MFHPPHEYPPMWVAQAIARAATAAMAEQRPMNAYHPATGRIIAAVRPVTIDGRRTFRVRHYKENR